MPGGTGQLPGHRGVVAPGPPEDPPAGKHRGVPIGAAGEALAAEWLAARHWRLVGQNVRARVAGRPAEIDLLLRKGRRYLAVEVKTRRGDPAPERSASAAQLERIAAALAALAPHLRPRPRILQVDVVAVCWPPSGRAGAPEVQRFPGPRWPATGPTPCF